MRTAWVALAIGILFALAPVQAQPTPWPSTVQALEPTQFSGHWYEVATTGSWAHRRCLSDTAFEWSFDSPLKARVVSTCTTSTGTERRTGRLKTSSVHPGQLTGSFAPLFLVWLPAAWDDYWVLAVGPERTWVLLGDRSRQRLSVLSRLAAPDESAMAEAIRAGRAQGFPVERLVPVLQHLDGRVAGR